MSIVLAGKRLLSYQNNDFSIGNSINQAVLLFLEKFEGYEDDDDSNGLKHQRQ